MPADWQLPPGVNRALWEFAADSRIARDEQQHLGETPLLQFDRQVVLTWFSTPGRLVDLGCGTGRSLVDFARRGFECVGVDLSQPSLIEARRRLADQGTPVPLFRGNLCELEFLEAGTFDYALLLFGTLGMVEGGVARASLLRHAWRVLRPGGRLALHVHSLWPHLFVRGGRRWLLADLLRRVRGAPDAGDTRRDYRGIPRILHHVFTHREIRSLLRATGFQVVREIPLRPTQATESDTLLEQTGLFRTVRATGWLLEAQRPVSPAEPRTGS